MANFITGIITLTIGVVLMATVFIQTVKDTNQTYACPANNSLTCNWSTAEIALWGLLTLVGIAGILYGVISVFGLN